MAVTKNPYPTSEPKAQPWGLSTNSKAFNVTEADSWKGNLAPGSQDWVHGYDAIASDRRYKKTPGAVDWLTAKKGDNIEKDNTDQTKTHWAHLLAHSNAQFCVHFNNTYYYYPLFV